MRKQNKTNKPGCVQAIIRYRLRHKHGENTGDAAPYLLRAFKERFKDKVEGVVLARVRHLRQARMRTRHVRVVVARLTRRPRVASCQRPALADHYVVVASMSLRIPIQIAQTTCAQ